MGAVQTPLLLPTKPFSDNNFEFKHGFKAEASLALNLNPLIVLNDTTKLCLFEGMQY